MQHIILNLIIANIYILVFLISLTLLLFFCFVKYIEHAQKHLSQEQDKINAKIIHAFVQDQPLMLKTIWQKKLALAIIIKYGQENTIDVHQYLQKNGLDKLLINDLHHKDNKILAMKNIYLSNIDQGYQLLKKFWYAKDFDESYFSLYYATKLASSKNEQEEILAALNNANFSIDRKIEMARSLKLTNEQLIKKLLQCNDEDEKHLYLASMTQALSLQQFDLLTQIIGNDVKRFYYACKILVQSRQLYCYHFIADWINRHDQHINRYLADLLKAPADANSFILLQKLLADPSYGVCYSAAISLLTYNQQGYEYLQKIQKQNLGSVAQQMADLQLKINTESR